MRIRPGLVIGATLSRDPPGDVLVLRAGVSIDDFRRSRGKGFKIGTNAVRRAAYARRLFPEVEVIHYRGAADTRVRKLDDLEMQRLPDGGEVGPADALIMARSGLERVGLAGRIAYEFSVREMLPAVGQGIVAVECAADDWQTRRILSGIDDPAAHRCADAEREVLWVLNGHCNSPIAGFSTIDGAQMSLTASVLDRSRRRCSSRFRAPAPPIGRANSAARSGSNCWPRARPTSSSAAGRCDGRRIATLSPLIRPHPLDHLLDMRDRGFRLDAVAEVEDQPAAGEIRQHVVDRAIERSAAGDQRQRIEIALNGDAVLHALADQ